MTDERNSSAPDRQAPVGIEIRHATTADSEALASCIDAAYAPLRATIEDLPDVSADCRGEIERNIVFVAIAGSSIVAGIVLVPGNDALMIANLAVHPEHQGTGLGRYLMALAQMEAREHSCAGLRLNTHARMIGTIRFYERLGWRQTAQSGNTVTMAKPVSA